MIDAALLRLILGQVCIHACMAGMRMAAPLLALQQGYSAAAVGVLLALFALTQVFLALPAGRYCDRHGLKRPVGYAIVVSAAGSGAALVFPTFAVLCFAALCTGGAAGIVVIALQRHVGRVAHDGTQLRTLFSWLAIGPSMSNFLGPFISGLLIDYGGAWLGVTGGYRLAFLLLTLLPAITWLCVRHAEELPPVIAASDGRAPQAWDLLADANFRRLLFVNWLLSSCWDVHTFVVPLLGHERGLSASIIGTILGAFAVATALIRVLMPMLAKHLREVSVVAGAMVATALLFAVYPLMPSALALGACSVLLGFALGSVQPMIMSMLHQITPPERHGEAIGLRLMAINGSSVVMPMLFGTLGAVIGVAGLFWIVGAAVGAGTREALRLRGGGEGAGH